VTLDEIRAALQAIERALAQRITVVRTIVGEDGRIIRRIYRRSREPQPKEK
jgi:hypothetical protein